MKRILQTKSHHHELSLRRDHGMLTKKTQSQYSVSDNPHLPASANRASEEQPHFQPASDAQPQDRELETRHPTQLNPHLDVRRNRPSTPSSPSRRLAHHSASATPIDAVGSLAPSKRIRYIRSNGQPNPRRCHGQVSCCPVVMAAPHRRRCQMDDDEHPKLTPTLLSGTGFSKLGMFL